MTKDTKTGRVVILAKPYEQVGAARLSGRSVTAKIPKVSIAAPFDMVNSKKFPVKLTATGAFRYPVGTIADKHLSASLVSVPLVRGARARLAVRPKVVFLKFVALKMLFSGWKNSHTGRALLGRRVEIEYYLRCHAVHVCLTSFVNSVKTARSRGSSLVRAFLILA
jgi:hypothetical protein